MTQKERDNINFLIYKVFDENTGEIWHVSTNRPLMQSYVNFYKSLGFKAKMQLVGCTD